MRTEDFGYEIKSPHGTRIRFISITEYVEEDEVIYYGYEKASDKYYIGPSWQKLVVDWLHDVENETTQEQKELEVIRHLIWDLEMGGYKNSEFGGEYDHAV